MFRKILWLFAILIFLFPIVNIGYQYFHAPSKSQTMAIKNLQVIGQQYVDGAQIDLSNVEGSDNNSQYVHAIGTYMSNYAALSNDLSKEKNLLTILIQPRSLASPQSIDVSLEKVAAFDKKLADIRTKLEANVQDFITASDALDKKGLILDVKAQNDKLQSETAQRQNRMQLYVGLSQYVKATLDFTKSRVGYYQLKSDDNIYFTAPQDQDYYKKLVDGVNQYNKQIDTLNSQDLDEIRKQLGDMNKHKGNKNKQLRV